MKKLFLILGLLLVWGAMSHADSSLDRVSLLDWCYPSETAYKTLQRAANSSGRQGWLVQRMQEGKSLPQASARELALDLADDPAVSAQDKADLEKAFKPEAADLHRDATGDSKTASLEKDFALMNRRMDELEATLKVNHYNGQSYPELKFTLNGAVNTTGGSGLLTGGNNTNNTSYAQVAFTGASDAGSFGYLLQMDQNIFNPNGPPRGGSGGISGQGFVTTNPGIKVSLGGGSSFYGGTLALASKAAPDPGNDFYISPAANAFTGASDFTTVDLKLGLPSGGVWMSPLIIATKEGESSYWPFSNFLVFWGPASSFYKTWDCCRANGMGVSGRMDTGTLWGLAERNSIYGSYVTSGNDPAQRRTWGWSDGYQSSWTYAIGSETTFPWGGQLFLEGAENDTVGSNEGYTFTPGAPSSHLMGYKPGVTYKGYRWDWKDQGYVAAYTQPIGFVTFGIEASHIGPLFTPGLGAVSGMLVDGTSSDPTFTNPSTMTPWENPPAPGGTVEGNNTVRDAGSRHIAYGTNVSNATALMSNAEKLVLQFQASFAWVSIGLFGGTASQLKPSGPWIVTNPRFEAGAVGWMLWEKFGYSYAPPPAPLAVLPPPTTGGTFGGPNVSYRLGSFNLPTEGLARFPGKATPSGVHWHGLSAQGYQDVSLFLLMTENGLGDNRVQDFGYKYVNYAAGNVRFDLQTLLERTLPFTVRFTGEQRDVAPQAGLPTFGDPAKPGDPTMSYFTQSVGSIFIKYGASTTFNILGIVGAETWRSDHTFYPLLISVHEYGIGGDMDLSRWLTGLSVFSRSRIYYLEDSFYSQRNFNAWEAILGTSIVY